MDPGALVAPAVAAAAAGVAGLAGWGAYAVERRHGRELAEFAAEQGWDLRPRDDTQVQRPGRPFGVGQQRRAQHVMTGVHAGRALVAFDYSCRTVQVDGQGQRHVQARRWSVLALRLPAFVPEVELVPGGAVTRVLGRGLQLESEAFNARYAVRTDSPRLAYDVLHPRTMQLLLERPTLSLRLLGAEAVSWESGRLRPAELRERLATMTAVLDAVPARVWADLGG